MIILKILVAYLMVGVLCGIIYILGALYVIKTLKGFKEEFRDDVLDELRKLFNTTTEGAIGVLVVSIVLFYPYVINYVIKHWKD